MVIDYEMNRDLHFVAP